MTVTPTTTPFTRAALQGFRAGLHATLTDWADPQFEVSERTSRVPRFICIPAAP